MDQTNPWHIIGGFTAAGGVMGLILVWAVNKWVGSIEGWLQKIDSKMEKMVDDHTATRLEVAGMKSEFVTHSGMNRRFEDFKDGIIAGQTNPGLAPWPGVERRAQPRD